MRERVETWIHGGTLRVTHFTPCEFCEEGWALKRLDVDVAVEVPCEECDGVGELEDDDCDCPECLACVTGQGVAA